MKYVIFGALLIPLLLVAGNVQAETYILDNTNNWTITLEPGATIQQPDFFSFQQSTITATNIEFATGTSDIAVFPGVSQLGDGVRLGGKRPKALVDQSIDFTILVTSSGNKYGARLTYFTDANGDAGVAPDPFNLAGAVFQIQSAVPEPETYALLMAGLGFVAAAVRRRRSTRLGGSLPVV